MGDQVVKKKSNLFRGWSQPNGKTDDELLRLEQQATQTRNELQRVREHGKQIRSHRLQALDALNTRQSTLTEILRRMEQELQDTDVFRYGDILAEVFGERKIFAHRAIGLESLLCQFMHQMLAKQHQLKIMKRAAKDIQGMMKKQKMQFNDDFFSYEALTVQLEVSRINMEALYDDIFTSQHRILARLKNEDPPPTRKSSRSLKAPPSVLVLSPTKTPRKQELKDQQGGDSSTSATKNRKKHSSKESDDDEGDLEAAMDVLSSPTEEDFRDEKKAQDNQASPPREQSLKERREHRKSRRKNKNGDDSQSVTSGDSSVSSRRKKVPAGGIGVASGNLDPAEAQKRNEKLTKLKTERLEQHPPDVGPSSTKSATSLASAASSGDGSTLSKPDALTAGAKKKSSGHSARERRRQIEQMRMGRVVGGASSQARSPSNAADLDLSDEEMEQKKARDRMRELEEIAKAKKDTPTTTKKKKSSTASSSNSGSPTASSGTIKGRWPPA